jgi:hypothetical protein
MEVGDAPSLPVRPIAGNLRPAPKSGRDNRPIASRSRSRN